MFVVPPLVLALAVPQIARLREKAVLQIVVQTCFAKQVYAIATLEHPF
jgi:hypothetical protein